jgi:ketosteroid isomerase-like protein
VSADAELADLRRRIEQLEDRQAILDCIQRHARGCDRHDVDLLRSTYHPDAIDEHGSAVNAGPEYAGWANAVHAASSTAHLHNVTTHTCEVQGDAAHAESYVIVVMLGLDGRTAQCLCGRYLDRLEKRDGAWRIAHRRSTVEVTFSGDASMLQSTFFQSQGYPAGARDRSDLSYDR